MKKVLITLCLLIVFGGCANKQAAKQKIGVTTITLQHQFFIDIDRGIKEVAEQNGIEVIVNDPAQDAARQTSAVEDFIQQKVNGMIVISIDGTTVVPAVEEAFQKVPVVTIDAVVKTDKITSHVGTVNEDAGNQLGAYLKKHITEKLNGKAKVGIITFLESPIQQDRIRGFRKALEGVNVTYLNPLPGYDREEALSSVESMLQANPDLDIIFATAENSVLGAKAALESAKNTKVKIVGFDLTPESADGIKSGTIVAMLQQQPFEMGRIAMNTLIKAMNGETVEKTIPTPVLIYDAQNIAEYK